MLIMNEKIGNLSREIETLDEPNSRIEMTVYRESLKREQYKFIKSEEQRN